MPVNAELTAIDKLPTFMRADGKAHVAFSMRQNPELWIAAAQFASVGVHVGDRLGTIMQALELKEIKTVQEWLSVMALYDPKALQSKGDDRLSNPDLPSNAFFLHEAVIHLLRLVKAPTALADDLSWLLKSKMPKKAEKRAKVQALLISNPGLSKKELAKAAKCSLKLINNDLENGVLVRLPDAEDC